MRDYDEDSDSKFPGQSPVEVRVPTCTPPSARCWPTTGPAPWASR